MFMDLTKINNVLILFSLFLVLLTISTLIYHRYKYFIDKKWMYGNILFNLILLFLIYQFPYLNIQIPLIAALISIYVMILVSSKDYIEISITNDIISQHMTQDLEYNPPNTPLIQPIYYDPFSPIIVPN